jgi:hypothetical protein
MPQFLEVVNVIPATFPSTRAQTFEIRLLKEDAPEYSSIMIDKEQSKG